MKPLAALQLQFKQELFCRNQSQLRKWVDLEWISEPVLHVPVELDQAPVALVGVATIYELHTEGEPTITQTQTGTAIFHYYASSWTTRGQVLLNITPAEALAQAQMLSRISGVRA
ncbi:MAG TPA: hypothetical protein PKA06_13980 [Gemmatales bacterium]|nr:hypothetical protein [Gemmatales bacterium]